MKKSSVLLTALLAGLMVVSATAAEPVTECYAPEKAATIDGVVSEGEWDGATRLTLNISDTSTWNQGGAGIVGSTGYQTYNHTDDDFSTDLAFMCDSDYVYILMTRKDTSLNFATDNYHTPYASDCGLMWFYDAEYGTQYGLQLLAGDKSGTPHIGYFFMDTDQGTSVDLTESEEAVAVTKVTGDTYVMEAKIQLSSMDDFKEVYKNGQIKVTWCAVNICEEGWDSDDGAHALWGNNYQAQYLGVNNWDVAPTLKFGEDSNAPKGTVATDSAETTALPVLDYPDMAIATNSGAGYATLEEAAASIGKTPVLGAEFVAGTDGNSDKESPAMLWDNDTATKYCVVGTFPTQSMAKLPAPITVDGIIMATANDNEKWTERSPFEWCVYGSADGENWTPIAYGDDSFFEEANFTYYATAVTPVENVQYIYFQTEGGLSGVYQQSELVVCGATGAADTQPTETVETPATTPVETPTETVETPATTTPVAPQTFDMGIVAAVAAVVSLAGYAVSKKR